MKDKIKSFEEFETRMKNQTVPVASLNQKIMAYKKVYKPIYLRTSFIAIFLSIFVTASIATAMNYTGWKLFDDEGKPIFEMRTMSEEEAEPHRKHDEIREKYRHILESLYHTMPKGTFKYFLSVDGYEQLGVTGGYGLTKLHNVEKIENVMQIPKDFKEQLLLNDELQIPVEVKESLYFEGKGPDNLVLTEGTIQYNFPYLEDDEFDALAYDMYLEAKENNSEYTVREGILSDEINELTVMYGESKETFGDIEITLQSANKGMSTTENIAEYMKVTEEGVEYLYDPAFQQVYFVVEDNSNKFLVTVRFTAKWEGQIVEMEDVIAIAKSILK